MKKIFLLTLTFWILASHSLIKAEDGESAKFTLSGNIKDAMNGESLIGATIYIKELKTGTTANVYGFYSITLPAGTYNIVYSFLGYESLEQTITLDKNSRIDIELKTRQTTMKEVVITGKKGNENITNTEMSVVKMNVETIKQIPALMGEVDIIKAIQLMPGVQSAGEGSSGFSVRGGSTDQNLILLDEASVYNASHLMGFFSVFNHDAVKDVKLYKGDIPAEFGGRLASLLDIRQKEGNMKKISGAGGIGLISSRLTLEGPIIKDKMSFIAAGRRSYADIFLRLSNKEEIKENIIYFYDFNFKANYIINPKNRLFISRYMGRDVVRIGSGADAFKMSWGNSTITMRYNHLFSDKLFSNFTYVRSHYDYKLGSDEGVGAFKWISDLKDNSFKADMGYYISAQSNVKFGAMTTLHQFEPGKVKGIGGESIFTEFKMPSSQALDHAFYGAHEQKLFGLLTINYGLRYTIFQNKGKTSLYKFNKANPQKYTVYDTIEYKKNEIFNTYSGLEPRFSLAIALNEISSIKASYSHTKQYIHLASNATVGIPLDIWLPSSPNIKPQAADQVALGYFRNFKENIFETSVEVYYKDMKNQIDFRDFAYLLLNPAIEGEIRVGTAKAYGVELLVRKQEGKVTGWVGYTYSESNRKIPEINNGKEYISPYNRPHNVSVVLNYQWRERLSFSANWVYSTGQPATMPVARYPYMNISVPSYTERNTYRMPDYHRMDVSVNLDSKKKLFNKVSSSWNFSVYNVYNRHNAFSIVFKQDKDDKTKMAAYKMYMFPIIPSITWNFKF